MLIKILNFFSLVDNDQKLSLTSIGLYTVLIKLAIAPSPSLTDVGALLLVLLNYAHKRKTNDTAAATIAENSADAAKNIATDTAEAAKQLSDLVAKVNALAIRVGMTGK